MTPFLIAVAGGSGSGKTTFVAKLIEDLKEYDVLVLHQDHYYRDLSHLSQEERNHHNFDHPDAIERDLFLQQIKDLCEGRNCQRPTYDFVTHTRKAETVTLQPKPVIIIDGIFSLYDARLFPLLHLKLYVDAEQDLRLARRVKRDLVERHRSLEGTFKQYFDTVKPMHAHYIEPTKYSADLIIPWRDYNIGGVQHISRMIRNSLKSGKF